MTFVINAIKQDTQNKKKSQNIKFLLDVDSPLFARKFIEKSWLILLSLSDYNSDPTKFWPVYVSVVFESKEVRVIWSKDISLKDFFHLFLLLWFEIKDGNTFSEPQSSEQITKVLAICKKELEEEKQIKQSLIQKEQEKEKKIYHQDDWLIKAKKVIERALNKVNTLLTEKWAFISAKDLRTIKEKVEELKKLRMWTNYEKIRDMLQELFSLVDHIEEDYYDSLKDTSNALFPWTIVTEVDLEKQVSILEKIKQQQMFWGTIPVNRKDYVAFGEILSYLVFLKKDFLLFLKNILNYIRNIFDIFQLILIVIFIILSWGIVFSLISWWWINTVYYSFFSLWFLGLLVYLFSLIKTKNPLYIILLFVLMIITYFISMPLLKNTFALS